MARALPLLGRTVLVSGAASGIGRQLALDLAVKEQARLILLDRDVEGLAKVAEAIDRASGEPRVTMSLSCDVANAQETAAAVAALGTMSIDALVNNAGVVYAGTFECMEMSDFERVVAVNLLGAARLARLTLPHLFRSRDPVIVNVASLAGLLGAPGLCAYSASKFGLVGFSEALAAELAGRVEVLTVCPAFVRTQVASAAMMRSGDPAERAARATAMNRWLERMGTSPAKASRVIIASMKRRRRLTLINPDAHLLFHLKRLWPSLTGTVVGAAYRGLRRRGVIGE
jgi:3-oxoacyl-[acyl-carrier protein] reductase